MSNISLTNKFFYLKNPLLQDGEQVINLTQKIIYENINNEMSISSLSMAINHSEDVISKVVNVLQKKQFIKIGNPEFALPEINNTNSLSFFKLFFFHFDILSRFSF